MTHLSILFFLFSFISIYNYGIEPENDNVDFNFNEIKLIDLIKLIAEKKHISIIYPVNSALRARLEQQTVTYELDKISLEKAWVLLQSFLSIAGFSITLKQENTYIIDIIPKKNTVGIWQDVLPIYINSSMQILSNINANQPIRYIYYFKQFKMDKELNKLIDSLKSVNAPPTVELNEQNGIMISDFAGNIASLISILEVLDNKEVAQTIMVLPIIHISAQYISDLFDTLKKAVGPNSNQTINLGNFIESTNVIAHSRTNSIILFGPEVSLEKIGKFIREQFDIPIGEGNSILHVYDVQYLDSVKLADIIQNFINGTQTTENQGSEQNKIDLKDFFAGTVIKGQALETLNASSLEPEIQDVLSNVPYISTGIEGAISIGGNRLLISALDDKWIQIKELIKKLDNPEPAVILDVVILDITRDINKQLSGASRNFTPLSFSGKDGVQYLSSQISNPGVILGPAPEQLAQDLLASVGASSMNRLAPAGSFIMSFNDPVTPGIWGLIQALDKIAKIKIVNHPFLVSTNNKSATIEQSDVRRGPGPLLQEEAGVFVIPVVNVEANFSIKMSPHLTRNLDRMRLDVEVVIDNFIGGTLNRQNRDIKTTVELQSGHIFALGGFTREDILEIDTMTPILGNIPFLGNFFRGTIKNIVINDIVILIMPTVIHPKKPEFAEAYTYDKVNNLQADYNNNRIIYNPRDPVDRLFFKESLDIHDSIFKTSGIAPKNPSNLY